MPWHMLLPQSRSSHSLLCLPLDICLIHKNFPLGRSVHLPCTLSPGWVLGEDEIIAGEIISKMSVKGYMIKRPLEIAEVFSLIGFSSLAVGMRLHTLIYATTLGVPVIALSYDPKVTAFMQSIHQPLCLNVETLSEDMLLKASERLINELSERRDDIIESLGELRKKAEENANYAIELLK